MSADAAISSLEARTGEIASGWSEFSAVGEGIRSSFE
jgi:hypothetical protein